MGLLVLTASLSISLSFILGCCLQPKLSPGQAQRQRLQTVSSSVPITYHPQGGPEPLSGGHSSVVLVATRDGESPPACHNRNSRKVVSPFYESGPPTLRNWAILSMEVVSPIFHSLLHHCKVLTGSSLLQPCSINSSLAWHSL